MGPPVPGASGIMVARRPYPLTSCGSRVHSTSAQDLLCWWADHAQVLGLPAPPLLPTSCCVSTAGTAAGAFVSISVSGWRQDGAMMLIHVQDLCSVCQVMGLMAFCSGAEELVRKLETGGARAACVSVRVCMRHNEQRVTPSQRSQCSVPFSMGPSLPLHPKGPSSEAAAPSGTQDAFLPPTASQVHARP